jgi:hypothetical protein
MIEACSENLLVAEDLDSVTLPTYVIVFMEVST